MVKQRQNAMSSAESELIAMSAGVRDIQYIRNVLGAIGLLNKAKPTTLLSDSSAAIAIADNSGLKDKTKHIALRYFQVRGLQKDGTVRIGKIGTDYNPSDIGTKALGPITFLRHRAILVQTIPQQGDADDSIKTPEDIAESEEESTTETRAAEGGPTEDFDPKA
jgi:hypothetical protein